MDISLPTDGSKNINAILSSHVETVVKQGTDKNIFANRKVNGIYFSYRSGVLNSKLQIEVALLYMLF